jgi:hypothetical protein
VGDPVYLLSAGGVTREEGEFVVVEIISPGVYRLGYANDPTTTPQGVREVEAARLQART